MVKLISSFIFLILLFLGCDSTEPIIEDTSGEVTINNSTNGFSFSKGKAISFPNSENISPDILILAHLDQQGTVLGVFFSTDSIRPAFHLVKEFSDVDSAKTFFYNLAEVPDSNYEDLAIPVKINQIWAVKTTESKYGKIVILNTNAYEYSPSPGFRGYYAEAKFKWKYQPNGSRYF
ncbi:hypothetical protein BMS3Abin03_01468 [bacterium BMS3Abin03]|nr:hypothetical protein BMS3Abin03_01468 [bacterium BMS3Abin03]